MLVQGKLNGDKQVVKPFSDRVKLMNDDLMAEEDLRGGNPGTGHSGPVMAAIFPPLIDICLIYCPDTGPWRGECQVSSAQIVLFWFQNPQCVSCFHCNFNCNIRSNLVFVTVL